MSMAAAKSSQVPRAPRRANTAWLPLPADLASCAREMIMRAYVARTGGK